MPILSDIVDAGLVLARSLGLVRPAEGRGQGHRDSDRSRGIARPNPYWSRSAAMLGQAYTPERLTRILIDRNQGYLQAWTDLADEAVEHDPHLFSQLAIRAQSVVETEFYVEVGEGSDGRAARRAADACRELYTHWGSREDGNFERWLHEFVWGAFYGRSLHEVLWARDAGLTFPEGLDLVETRRLSLACEPDAPDPWALRIWDEYGIEQTAFCDTYGRRVSEFHPDKFLINEPRVRGSQKTREGLFAIVCWFELFRTWSWRELMNLAEMISKPPVVGYYSAGGAKADGDRAKLNGERNATREERTLAEQLLFSPTGALRGLLPDTVRVEALRYGMPTSDPVPILTARECEALVSKAINGVANLSDLKNAARAAVETQERTTHTFWRADVRHTVSLISRLFGRFVRANPQRFGEGCPVPRLVGRVEASKDTETAGRKIVLARSLGMRIGRAWAHEELEIPEPDEGDEVLEAMPSPAAPAKPGTPQDGTKPDPSGAPPSTPEAHGAVALSAGAQPSGAIVCLVPPPEVAAALVVEGGEALGDLHITLAHLGDVASLDDAQRMLVRHAVRVVAEREVSINGVFNGVARFSAPDGTDAAVVTLDAPLLGVLRDGIVTALDVVGVSITATHGFVPHLTRAYVPAGAPLPGGDRIEPLAATFTTLALWLGAERVTFPLRSAP